MKAEEARTGFQRSQQLFGQGEFAQALDQLDVLAASFPNDRNILYPKALCLAKLGRTQEAAELCERLLADFGDRRAEALRAALPPSAAADGPVFKPIDLGLGDVPPSNPYRSLAATRKPAWRKRFAYVGLGVLVLAAAAMLPLLAGKMSWGEATDYSTSNRPLYESELIFPVHPKHSHGSSIVQCPNGDLLACWFHGSGERKADDVLVQGARLEKGARKWSPVFKMADTAFMPDCNPVLFIDPQQTLWLFWITVQQHEWGMSLLKYSKSTRYAGDGAPVWDREQIVVKAEPKDLEPMMLKGIAELKEKNGALLAQQPKLAAEVEAARRASSDPRLRSLGWMTRLHPIMTSENRIMLGLYSDLYNTSAAAFTEDWGKTWEFSQPILTYEFGNIQPSFVMKKNGNIVAFMRDNGQPHKIRRAESTDRGVTWSEVMTLPIINPGSSLECIALRNGHWVLVCNDAPGRYLLTAYLSEDEGETWPISRPLEDFVPEQGSASYPSLLQAADGSIHVTYSYENQEMPGGKTIKHARFNEAWLRAPR